MGPLNGEIEMEVSVHPKIWVGEPDFGGKALWFRKPAEDEMRKLWAQALERDRATSGPRPNQGTLEAAE